MLFRLLSLRTQPLILFLFLFCLLSGYESKAQFEPYFSYSVSMLNATTHEVHVELQSGSWKEDTVNFKMPKWTPGYYQIMNYADAVINIIAKDDLNRTLPLKKLNNNTWTISGIKNKKFTLGYDVIAEKQFVAQSYLDSARAYLVPAGVFLFADGCLNRPVTVKIEPYKKWKIATGLEPVKETTN